MAQNSNSGNKADKLAPVTPGGETVKIARDRQQTALDKVMAQMPGYLRPHEVKAAKVRAKARLAQNQEGS